MGEESFVQVKFLLTQGCDIMITPRRGKKNPPKPDQRPWEESSFQEMKLLELSKIRIKSSYKLKSTTNLYNNTIENII